MLFKTFLAKMFLLGTVLNRFKGDELRYHCSPGVWPLSHLVRRSLGGWPSCASFCPSMVRVRRGLVFQTVLEN